MRVVSLPLEKQSGPHLVNKPLPIKGMGRSETHKGMWKQLAIDFARKGLHESVSLPRPDTPSHTHYGC